MSVKRQIAAENLFRNFPARPVSQNS